MFLDANESLEHLLLYDTKHVEIRSVLQALEQEKERVVKTFDVFRLPRFGGLKAVVNLHRYFFNLVCLELLPRTLFTLNFKCQRRPLQFL